LNFDNAIKYVALGFLAFVAIASVVIYGYDVINGISVPGIIQSVIAASVGYALHALGVQAGSISTLNGVHAEKEAITNGETIQDTSADSARVRGVNQTTV
jgi:hypothetical protein